VDRTEVIKMLAGLFRGIADGLLESLDAVEEETQPQAAESAPAEEPEQEEKPLTLEEVRAVLAEKSRAGHTAEVKKLLKKHGNSKLSGIDPSEYQALLAEVEAL